MELREKARGNAVPEDKGWKRSGKRVLQWMEEAGINPSSSTAEDAAADPLCGGSEAKQPKVEPMVRIGGTLYPRAVLPEHMRATGASHYSGNLDDNPLEGLEEPASSKHARYLFYNKWF